MSEPQVLTVLLRSPSLDAEVLTALRTGLGPDVQLAATASAHPATGLDFRRASDRQLGDGFLSLSLARPAKPADDWRPQGALKRLTRQVRGLVLKGVVQNLVVHTAGAVVLDPATWLRLTQEVDDDSHRPFLALLDFGLTDGVLQSHGMAALGLPDAEVPSAHEGLNDSEAFARAQEAVQFACHRMVHDGRPLEPGETLAVPIGLQVGSGMHVEHNEELGFTPCIRYRVDAGARLRLVPLEKIHPVSAHWAEAAAENSSLAFPVYRWMLLSELERQGNTLVATWLSGQRPPEVPGHEVLVFRRPDGRYLLCTCGLARALQPGGDDAHDNGRIELMLNLPGHGPPVAELLAQIGWVFHVRGPDAVPIGPEHRISWPLQFGRLDIGAVVMGWMGRVEFPPGPGVCFYAPLLMTDSEALAVPSAGREEWLHGPGASAEVRERWLRLL